MIPAREALSGLLLLVLLGATILLVPEAPGPGPLALVAGVAALHAALLSPLVGKGPASFGFLAALLSLPALAATSYGHPGLEPLVASALFVGFAAASGAAARALGPSRAGLYGPSMALVFAAPYALRYLVSEFGTPGAADRWLALSPWAAAERIAQGEMPPWPAVFALLAWPIWAITRRGLS